MDAYQTRRCLRVIDDLLDMHISVMFAQPVDPERDGIPNYFQIIRRPMDLGTVRKKLEDGSYSSVAQWKEDVELIWENCYKCNGRPHPNVIVSILAKHLQLMFNKATEKITDDPKRDWLETLDMLKADVDRITKKPTVPPPKPPSNKQMATRQHSDRDTRKSHAAAPAAARAPKPKTLTQDEIVELMQRVNDLADDFQVQQVFQLIRTHEPHLATNSEELEIDVNKLKPGTLVALRDLVVSFQS